MDWTTSTDGALKNILVAAIDDLAERCLTPPFKLAEGLSPQSLMQQQDIPRIEVFLFGHSRRPRRCRVPIDSSLVHRGVILHTSLSGVATCVVFVFSSFSSNLSLFMFLFSLFLGFLLICTLQVQC